jgi:ABC-2 type transport system ATP-binding protein
MTGYAIRADGLVKSFGSTPALRGVSLRVLPGSVCALLGRNGAGKTTTVRILTTLIQPDEGRAEVAGFDVTRDPERVRARIGVAGQSPTVDELLTGRQNLDLIGRMYHLGPARSRRRAVDLLDEFGLTDAADRQVKSYSGGMRRRLDLAASLLSDPPVLFLDEPTTGLDPVSRVAMWQAIRDLVAGGTTVLLTTQHLEEADQLADEIVVISGGVVAAAGAPAQLTSTAGHARLRVTLAAAVPAKLWEIQAALGPGARIEGRAVTAPAPGGLASLTAAVGRLQSTGAAIHQAGLEYPTLEEVFTSLTGGADPIGQPGRHDGGSRRLETSAS